MPIVKSCSHFHLMWRNFIVLIFLDFETAHICFKKTDDKSCLQDSGNEHILWIRAVVKSHFIIITWNKSYYGKENIILAITDWICSAVELLLIAALSFFLCLLYLSLPFQKKKSCILSVAAGTFNIFTYNLFIMNFKICIEKFKIYSNVLGWHTSFVDRLKKYPYLI